MPASCSDLGDRAPGRDPQPGVERREGLVEQHELGLAGERPRERDALLLAARELVRPAAPRAPRRARPSRAARATLAGWPCGPSAPRGVDAEGDVLADGEVREERAVLRHVADVAVVAPAPRRPSPASARPLSVTEPASARSKPAMRRSSVVLPEPDGPTMAVVLPGSTDSVTPRSTCWVRSLHEPLTSRRPRAPVVVVDRRDGEVRLVRASVSLSGRFLRLLEEQLGHRQREHDHEQGVGGGAGVVDLAALAPRTASRGCACRSARAAGSPSAR